MSGDRSLAVIGLGALGGLILALSYGAANDYTTICQDVDYVRLDDSACDRGDRGSTIMYVSTSSDYRAPAVGGKVDQYRVVNVVPQGKTVQKNAIAKDGGVVKNNPNIIRGIFGGAFKGSSAS